MNPTGGKVAAGKNQNNPTPILYAASIKAA